MTIHFHFPQLCITNCMMTYHRLTTITLVTTVVTNVSRFSCKVPPFSFSFNQF